MTSKPAEDVVVPDKQIDSNNVDNQTIQKNPNNKDDDPGMFEMLLIFECFMDFFTNRFRR